MPLARYFALASAFLLALLFVAERLIEPSAVQASQNTSYEALRAAAHHGERTQRVREQLVQRLADAELTAPESVRPLQEESQSAALKTAATTADVAFRRANASVRPKVDKFTRVASTARPKSELRPKMKRSPNLVNRNREIRGMRDFAAEGTTNLF